MGSGPFSNLNLTNPVIAAPLAGGPSTPALVRASARAGSLGFLGGGYKTPAQLDEEIKAVKFAAVPFGVNLFAPNPLPVDRAAFRRYARLLQPEADQYGLDLADSSPIEHDDHWKEKIEVLLATPVPVVSFTFGIPDRAIIMALRKAGTMVLQTVTSLAEARLAADSEVDALAVQGSEAGGHYGTLTPRKPPRPIPLPQLVQQIHEAVRLPLVAAGGLATSSAIAAVLRAGAAAAMVGTVLLRTDESGASAAYKAGLADRGHLETIVTRAFTGRPARALPNLFIQRYNEEAPFGYPAIHHLTRTLRKAAAAAGDAERINLWAGTGHRHAESGPAGDILERLAEGG